MSSGYRRRGFALAVVATGAGSFMNIMMLLLSVTTMMRLVGQSHGFVLSRQNGAMTTMVRRATTTTTTHTITRGIVCRGLWSGPGLFSSSLSSSSSSSDTDHVVPLTDLYAETPLIRSRALSDRFGTTAVSVYLKLDCLQSSGSFKDRGMARLCHHLYHARGCRRLVSSSGGNAGLAVATVASRLPGLAVEVVVPRTTKPIVVDKLASLGADVTVHGDHWNEADRVARDRVARDPSGAAAYVSPYDDPLLWEGHATLVPEVVRQLGAGRRLAGLVVSVGGGGLLCGVLQGLRDEHHHHGEVRVVAAETTGCNAFARAWEAGRPVALSKIDSVATSLGALEVTEESLVRGRRHGSELLQSSVCTDEEAVRACVEFAQDHRVLVEPACGAALATVYSDRLRDTLWAEVVQQQQQQADEMEELAIVIEVCGGSGVNLELMNMWKEQFGIE